MIKKIIVLIAAFGLITGTVSCTSTSSDSDATAEADDIASLDAGSEGGDDLLMGTEASEEELGSDETALTDDSSSELSASTDDGLSTEETASTDEVSLETVTEVLPGDDTMTASNAESAQTLGEVPAPVEPAAPAADQTNWDSMSSGNEVALSATTTTTEYSTGSAETSVEAPKIGLQKMATTPWKQGKTNYNTLYFARPGDSIASISQMIYGSDRTAELLKGNPTYQTREVRPGDKVYYQSPNRPTDDTKIITYYEDIGLAPEMYVAQSDEKLRDVANTVLGYKDGWKELWSINDIESKSTVSAGTQLKFWKGAPASATMASNTMPSMNETPQMPEVAPAMPVDSTPPPPAQDPMAMAGSEMPSAEDLDAQLGMNNSEMPAAANMDMPPPPPPPTEMAPPPPPPPMAAAPPPAVEESFEEEVPAMDSEMMMALGVIGAAAALLAGLMVIRKKKQREMEQALNETQVG